MDPSLRDGASPEAVLDAVGAAADEARLAIILAWTDVDPPQTVHLNATAEALFGGGPDTTVWDFIVPEDLPHLRELWARRQRGEAIPSPIRTTVITRSGTRMPVEIASHRTTIGGRPAAITYVADVTERRDATDALARSELRFRNVVESAPDGVAIVRQGRFVYLNPPAARMLGHDHPETALGVRLDQILRPVEAARAHARIATLLDTQRRLPDPAEYVSRHVDGSEIFVEISSIPIEYEGAPAVLAFARDVTERRALHERFVQADRLAAVGTLAAGVAHEINNPLAYLLLSVESVRRELADVPLPREQRARVDARIREAITGAERVATIVRDLKTFARPAEMESVPVDVDDVIRAALRVAQPELRHRATVRTTLACQARVLGSAQRLEQAILNLLVNAAHAMDPEDPGQNVVSVSTTSDGGLVTIVVEDNGRGIPVGTLPRVFDPFFTTKPPGVGTGLGLPVCRAIIESHGGEISIESSVGEGTRAVVRLPTAEAWSHTPPPPPPSSRVVRPHARLLIVDDEPALLAALEISLDGYAVTTATSAEEAMAVLTRDAAFDVVLCDVMMPRRSGLDLLALVQAEHPALAQRFLFMTGGGLGTAFEAAVGATGLPRLEKPFRAEQVRRLVDTVLGVTVRSAER